MSEEEKLRKDLFNFGSQSYEAYWMGAYEEGQAQCKQDANELFDQIVKWARGEH